MPKDCMFLNASVQNRHTAKTLNSSRILCSYGAGSAEPLEVKRGTLQVLTLREMTHGKKMEDAA